MLSIVAKRIIHKYYPSQKGIRRRRCPPRVENRASSSSG